MPDEYCEKAGTCTCGCYACKMRIHCRYHSEGCHETCIKGPAEVIPLKKKKKK